MKKRKKLLLFVMIFSMSLAGCGKQGAGETVTQSSETNGKQETVLKESAKTEGVETVYPVTIAGSDGVELTLKEEPKKVISVAPNITEILFSIEAQEKMVGRTDYCDFPKEVEKLESIGTLQSPDLEKIVSLEPDLVIVSTHFSQEARAQLEAAGILVLYLYEEHQVNGVFDLIETLGIAVNRQKEAKEVVDEMKEKLDLVAQKLKETEPVDVYYVVGFGEGGEYTAGGDTFIHEILTMAGGKNIASAISGWSYSLESLIEANPEVILVPNYAYDSFIVTEPYCDLSAVKEERVYPIDNNLLDRQDARNADAVVEIAKLLHPDRFAEE